MVGIHLEGREKCRHNQSPQVLTPIGQHDTRYQRRKVGQRPHLPDVSGGNDNEEIRAESPHHRAQRRQIPAEVEGAQQEVEAQEVDEHIPDILGQPQVVGINDLSQQIGAVVRGCRLVGRHTAEQGVGPAGALTRTLIILLLFLSGSHACRGIVTIEDAPLRVGREEIGEGQDGKQQYGHNVGHEFLECSHNLQVFYVSACKGTKIFVPLHAETIEKRIKKGKSL